MHPPPLVLCVVLFCLCLSAAGCTREGDSRAESPADSITEQRARELFVRKYRSLFSDKFFKLPNGTVHAFPTYNPGDIDLVEGVGDAWVLQLVRYGGVTVTGRVAKNGEWTELNTVRYASE